MPTRLFRSGDGRADSGRGGGEFRLRGAGTHPVGHAQSLYRPGRGRSLPRCRHASSDLVTGAPILEGAAASFDCEVQERIPSGTHSLYIGRVVAAAFLDADTLLPIW